MSLLGLLFSLALAALALGIVLMPFWQARSARPTLAGGGRQREAQALQRRYEQLLMNLQSLDDDFATGKFPAAQHAAEREALLQRGENLLREMDELESRQRQQAESLDNDIEAAIADAIAASRSREKPPAEGR